MQIQRGWMWCAALGLTTPSVALAQEVIEATPRAVDTSSPATNPEVAASEPTAPTNASPVAASAAQEPPAPAAPAKEANPFYKGELGSPGAAELENPHDAIFIGLGYFNTGGVLGQHYARLTPSLDLHFEAFDKPLTLRFAGPINVLLYDYKSTEKNHGAGTLRPEDYDEVGDYLRLIKQVRLGRKEDKFYLDIGQHHGASLGHGTVMRRYNPNMDADRTRLGIQLDAYNDYGGFETFVADLAFQTRLLGGLAFAKPAAFFSNDAMARTWSLGVHYTTDLAAPKELKRRPPSMPGSPGRAEVDNTGYPLFTPVNVGIFGIDSEIKALKFGNLVDLKVYIDYSRLVGAGGGATGGLLLRSNFGARPLLSALRVRLEGRIYDHDYVPQYFDSLYEVQKFQMIRGKATGKEPTKYAAVVNNPDTQGHATAYLEATYALVDKLVFGIGLERFLDQDAYNFLASLEVPAFEFLRLYASYQKLGFQDLGRTFARGNRSSFSFESDAVLLAQARVMILPILFASAAVRQTYQWDDDFRAADGSIVGSYAPSLDYLFEIEVGWEFGD